MLLAVTEPTRRPLVLIKSGEMLPGDRPLELQEGSRWSGGDRYKGPPCGPAVFQQTDEYRAFSRALTKEVDRDYRPMRPRGRNAGSQGSWNFCSGTGLQQGMRLVLRYSYDSPLRYWKAEVNHELKSADQSGRSKMGDSQDKHVSLRTFRNL